MKIDVSVETKIERTSRVKQLEAMFDVPAAEMSRLEWRGEVPIESMDWNVGLIVGPSGCGKSTIAKQMFGDAYHPELTWRAGSVIDDFPRECGMDAIAAACQAVGFNTIPGWMRPFVVLSNGEKFRVELARRILGLPDPVVVDEFTSVVDRQVAQIGSHAIQKWVRRNNRKFVAVGCHYDVIDWLQPDWIFEPATTAFAPRGRLQRPKLEVTIQRVPYRFWSLFAPFHYLTADLHKAARCFCLFVGDRPASFGAMLHRPHPRVRDIMGLSRAVTLPDFQGLGLMMILADALGSAYKAIGKRMHSYPAHPAFIRSFDKSPRWALKTKPMSVRSSTGNRRLFSMGESDIPAAAAMGGRPCAVFEYAGEAMSRDQAVRLLGGA